MSVESSRQTVEGRAEISRAWTVYEEARQWRPTGDDSLLWSRYRRMEREARAAVEEAVRADARRDLETALEEIYGFCTQDMRGQARMPSIIDIVESIAHDALKAVGNRHILDRAAVGDTSSVEGGGR